MSKQRAKPYVADFCKDRVCRNARRCRHGMRLALFTPPAKKKSPAKPPRKLTDEEVKAREVKRRRDDWICALWRADVSAAEIASQLRVSYQHVNKVVEAAKKKALEKDE